MTRLTRAAAGGGLLLVAILVGARFALSPREPTLTLVLRCDTVTSGTLTAGVAGDEPDQFDLQRACGAGTVQLRHYRPQQPVRLRLKTAEGESELIATPGDNIQAEKHGYFAVVKVSGAPLRLRNDTL